MAKFKVGEVVRVIRFISRPAIGYAKIVKIIEDESQEIIEDVSQNIDEDGNITDTYGQIAYNVRFINDDQYGFNYYECDLEKLTELERLIYR